MLGYSVRDEEAECTEKYEVCFLNLRPTTPTQLPPRMFLFVCVCVLRFLVLSLPANQGLTWLYQFINLFISLNNLNFEIYHTFYDYYYYYYFSNKRSYSKS